jgi:hypothetical protein
MDPYAAPCPQPAQCTPAPLAPLVTWATSRLWNPSAQRLAAVQRLVTGLAVQGMHDEDEKALCAPLVLDAKWLVRVLEAHHGEEGVAAFLLRRAAWAAEDKSVLAFTLPTLGAVIRRGVVCAQGGCTATATATAGSLRHVAEAGTSGCVSGQAASGLEHVGGVEFDESPLCSPAHLAGAPRHDVSHLPHK